VLVKSHEGPAFDAPRVPSLPQKLLALLPSDGTEFIPVSTDVVSRIRHQIVKDGIKYLFVKFKDAPDLRLVRRCVMDYMYPVSVVLYLAKVEQRALSLT
jgi:hypothetical protein